MDMTEIIKLRDDLEKNIHKHIAAEIDKFAGATGLSPSAVIVGMAEQKNFGDSRPKHVVCQVSVIVEI